MGTKLMPKRSKIPKMTPGGKIIIFLYEFGPIQGARSAPLSVQNPIKIIQKSRPEIDAGKVSPNDAQIMKKLM